MALGINVGEGFIVSENESDGSDGSKGGVVSGFREGAEGSAFIVGVEEGLWVGVGGSEF